MMALPWPSTGRALPPTVVILDLGVTLISVRRSLFPVTWAVAPLSKNQSSSLLAFLFTSAAQMSKTSAKAASSLFCVDQSDWSGIEASAVLM
jgi:hypothetical protein